jgi:hypothetical protein
MYGRVWENEESRRRRRLAFAPSQHRTRQWRIEKGCGRL